MGDRRTVGRCVELIVSLSAALCACWEIGRVFPGRATLQLVHCAYLPLPGAQCVVIWHWILIQDAAEHDVLCPAYCINNGS